MPTSQNNKIRIRTDQELEDRRKGLVEISDILDSLGIRSFLLGGALLGALREKNFIKWDWDVEIGVYSKEALSRKKDIVNALERNGFIVSKINNTPENFKIDVSKYQPATVTSYSIYGWQKGSRYWERVQWKMPRQFLDTLSEIDFLGRTYNCPHDPIEYVKFFYGDEWQTPKRTDDKNEYILPQGTNQQTLIKRMKFFISKILSRK